MVKVCITCKEEKEHALFHKNSRSKSGRNNTCSECSNKYTRNFKRKNKDKVRIYNEKYKSKNKDLIREINRVYRFNRYNSDLEYKALTLLRNRILKSLSRKSETTLGLLGATTEKIIEYLNNNDYGFIFGDKDIDLDHIIPLSSTNDEKIVKELCHYTNLQLLPSDYNRYIKGNNKFNKKHFEKWMEKQIGFLKEEKLKV